MNKRSGRYSANRREGSWSCPADLQAVSGRPDAVVHRKDTHSREDTNAGWKRKMADNHGQKHPAEREIQGICIIAEDLYGGIPDEENQTEQWRDSAVLH